MWKPWKALPHHPGGDGFVEREWPDGRIVKVPYYCDAPTLHRILKGTWGGQYGESRWFEEGEIAYLSEGLARLFIKRGFAEPLAIH